MAKIPTYQEGSNAPQLGQTAKISVSGSPVAQSLTQLSGGIQDVAKVAFEFDQRIQQSNDNLAKSRINMLNGTFEQQIRGISETANNQQEWDEQTAEAIAQYKETIATDTFINNASEQTKKQISMMSDYQAGEGFKAINEIYRRKREIGDARSASMLSITKDRASGSFDQSDDFIRKQISIGVFSQQEGDKMIGENHIQRIAYNDKSHVNAIDEMLLNNNFDGAIEEANNISNLVERKAKAIEIEKERRKFNIGETDRSFSFDVANAMSEPDESKSIDAMNTTIKKHDAMWEAQGLTSLQRQQKVASFMDEHFSTMVSNIETLDQLKDMRDMFGRYQEAGKFDASTFVKVNRSIDQKEALIESGGKRVIASVATAIKQMKVKDEIDPAKIQSMLEEFRPQLVASFGEEHADYVIDTLAAYGTQTVMTKRGLSDAKKISKISSALSDFSKNKLTLAQTIEEIKDSHAAPDVVYAAVSHVTKPKLLSTEYWYPGSTSDKIFTDRMKSTPTDMLHKSYETVSLEVGINNHWENYTKDLEAINSLPPEKIAEYIKTVEQRNAAIISKSKLLDINSLFNPQKHK